MHYPRPTSFMLEILPRLGKKMILRCRALHRIVFEYEYLGKFEIEFEMVLGYKLGD
jgi:hypothetical protein